MVQSLCTVKNLKLVVLKKNKVWDYHRALPRPTFNNAKRQTWRVSALAVVVKVPKSSKSEVVILPPSIGNIIKTEAQT